MQQLVELFEPSIELVQPFRKTKRAVTDFCGIIARLSIKILNLCHILDVLLILSKVVLHTWAHLRHKDC